MDPNYILDRIKLKKNINFWRGVSVGVLLLFIVLIYRHENKLDSQWPYLNPTPNFIARINIKGIIYEDKERLDAIDNLIDDNKIKAAVVYIDSPGGTIVGSEGLYNHLLRLGKKVPLVVSMGEIATSGGYLTALVGERIFANSGTLTGSIGVILQSYEITELAEKLGIGLNSFKSSEFKASPNLFEKVTPKVREAIDASIQDSFEFFVDLVQKRRALSKANLEEIKSGKVYTGRQALKYNLIDRIGDEHDAVKWLRKKYSISDTIKTKDIDLHPESSKTNFLLRNYNDILQVFTSFSLNRKLIA